MWWGRGRGYRGQRSTDVCVKWCKQMKPNSLQEVNAINGLTRTGDNEIGFRVDCRVPRVRVRACRCSSWESGRAYCSQRGHRLCGKASKTMKPGDEGSGVGVAAKQVN